MSNIDFSENERHIILDKEFLIAKVQVIEKIQILFENIRSDLFQVISDSNFVFPPEIDIKVGKIFKGENYKLLPYVVLDYPKLFSKKNTFNFRTMFWWGNFFSTTLHLEGESFKLFRENIYAAKHLLIKEEIYLCVNDTPWEYHYGPANYVPLTENNFHEIDNIKFLKLSKKYSLADYHRLNRFVIDDLEFCLKILGVNKL